MLAIVDLSAESAFSVCFFVGDATHVGLTCVARCPQTKNATRAITSNIIETGFGQNQPLTIPLGHSALCALSPALYSPLKPPNDTPRPVELN